jgi:hypothetical protein
MVLVILLTNVLRIKVRMMKITQTTNKHIKEKEPQRKISRKSYTLKKTSPHEMKMKSMIVKNK